MVEFFVGMILGMVLGMWLLSRWIIYKISELLASDPEIRKIMAQDERSVIDARIERLGDEYYIYDTKDGRFLAQGRNLDDVRDKIQGTMQGRDVTVRLVEGDPDDIQRFRQAS